ncbi:hypothetical protein ACU80C_18845 [Bacillus mycoides]|uniref:hypothetical protein n=1 Tax=Bacillus TaxID=1386 RepID=UPI00065BF9E1|nr:MULTISPECIES: hypothetical protein [Bacillus]KMQ14157.1 hypothetical protein TU70_26520 [Bacillus mycoides]MBG9595807.1 hypothetical protein [Bacillus mycoides]MED1115873.1 hypothetical protein [Bacillus paramycoides]PQZ39943.1 hypothetical protein CQZ94_30470 [Bacillus sp. MYb209]SFQ54794.1 hypothetical protein SAMN04487920_102120 [Bacillus mycoides]
MDKSVLEKIELVKNILGDDPFSLVIGEIVEEEKIIDKKLEETILKDYYFITSKYKILNGGVITIYGHQKLESIQFYTEDMPGGADKWLCIGTIENYPLFIDKINGEISCLFGDLIDQNFVIESYGDFNNFLQNYYLGQKYCELGNKFVQSGGISDTVGSKDDDWYQLLEDHNLL